MGRRSETSSENDVNEDEDSSRRNLRGASKRQSAKEIEENEEEVPTSSRTPTPRGASKRKSLKEVDEEESEEEERQVKRKTDQEYEHSEADAEDSGDEAATTKPSTSNNKRKTKARPDDESNNDENEEPQPKKGRKKKAKEAAVKSDSQEYEVEKIVGDRAIKGRIQYKIRWKGYLSEDDTWENESTLDCNELIEEYNDTKGDDSRANGSSGSAAAKTPKSKGRPAKNVKSAKTQKRDTKSSGNQSASNPNEEEWEVLKIIDMHTLKNGSREFLVRWKGYPPEEDSWEPEEHLKGTDILVKFLKKVEQNATPLRSGRRQTAKVDYNQDEDKKDDDEELEEKTAIPQKRGRPAKASNPPQAKKSGFTLAEIEEYVNAVIDKRQHAQQDKLNELLKSVDELKIETESLRKTLKDVESKMAA